MDANVTDGLDDLSHDEEDDFLLAEGLAILADYKKLDADVRRAVSDLITALAAQKMH